MGNRRRTVVNKVHASGSLIAYSNGEEATVRTRRGWRTFSEEPLGAYSPPDSSPVYQRLLYTGGHLFLKAYWPKYGRLRQKIKEARQRAKTKSNDSKILEDRLH